MSNIDRYVYSIKINAHHAILPSSRAEEYVSMWAGLNESVHVIIAYRYGAHYTRPIYRFGATRVKLKY